MENDSQQRLIEILEYWKILEFIDQENITLQKNSSKQLLKQLRSGKAAELEKNAPKKLEVFHYFLDLEKTEDYIDAANKFQTADPEEIFSYDLKLMEADVRELLKKDCENLNLYPVEGSELFFVVGAIERNDIVNYMRENFYDSENLPELPELTYSKDEKISLFSFKASADGSYVCGSLKLSPLLWAISCWKTQDVKHTKSLSLDLDEYYKAQAQLEKIVEIVKTADGSDKVKDFLPLMYKQAYKKYVENLFPNFGREIYHTGFFEYNRYADEKTMKADIFPEDYTKMNSSFFKDDLNKFEAMIKNGDISNTDPYGHALINFVQSGYYSFKGMEIVKRMPVPTGETEKRSFEFFKYALDIMKAPLGKWPAKFKPSLMQQTAINLAISEKDGQPIFSVNGPPGTGKTTLLKEILAEYIVRRAYALSKDAVNSPDEAFEKCSFKFGPQKKYGSAYLASAPNYFKFKNDSINNYGVLVASCNNSAVENITVDLPKLDDVLNSLAPYKVKFKIPNKTKNKKLSAALGKKYTLAKPDKINPFAGINRGLKEVNALFDPKLSEDIENTETFDYEKAEFSEQDTHDILFTRLSDRLLNDPQKYIDAKGKNSKDESVKPVTRTWGLISAPLGRSVNIKNYCKQVLKPFLKSYGSPEKRAEHLNKYVKARARFLNQLETVKKMRNELAAVCEECTSVYAEYKIPEKYSSGADKIDVIDKKFITDYLSEDEESSTAAQLSNPWATDRFNREREKLFFYACKFHKEFTAASDAVRQNVENILVYWGSSDGESKYMNKAEKGDVFPSLLQSLFLLTPVLSTTFASAGRLLKDIGKPGVIGVLIVDESGQAQPHMAIGSLMRCRKAIIVGDPKQVEPVVTAEADIFKQIMTSPVLDAYKEKTISVQSFADCINPYGTFLGSGSERQWVGCPLVVHRRCADPMYSISNELSYDNTMKNPARKPKKDGFILPSSCWIDVNGICVSDGNRFVEQQGQIVVKLLKKAFKSGKIPKLYIISPFKTVSGGIEKMLKSEQVRKLFSEHKDNYEKWLDDNKNKNIGTVHTFQGKGTDEVIFLLGCDPHSAGAVNWVNRNIVNVAATRAKQRFYVIGSRDVWIGNKSLKVAFEKIGNTVSPTELDELLCESVKPGAAETETKRTAARINACTNADNDDIPLPLNCPKCGKALRFKYGKYGWFIACSGFPRCKKSFAVLCPECGKKAVIQKNRKDNKLYLRCTDPNCQTSNFTDTEQLQRIMV